MASVVKPAPSALPEALRFGEPEYRVDGREKVSGQARYSADFAMPEMLWAAFAASPVPHARIVSIDTTRAKEISGVRAVLTGAEIGEHYFGRRVCDWPVLAIDRVRFVGEYVAAVAADTPEIAAEAAAAIEVEYEDLPTLFDPEEALRDDSPILHEHPERYPYLGPGPTRHPVPHPNLQGYELHQHGDWERAFNEAAHVFEHTFTTPRIFAAHIEPRATLVWIDEDGTVHVISTNKSPFALRQQLAVATGVPQEKIVVEPAWIGGDFGAKGLSIEEFPCYFLAAATKRPIKHVRTYNDDMRTASIRHASRITVKGGYAKDGRIVALDIRVLFDGGAYAAAKVIPNIIPGPPPKIPYRCLNTRLQRLAAYTNSLPAGFVRAPGDIQFMFALESHIDIVARELGIDPLEFRLRNAVIEGDHDAVEWNPIVLPAARKVLETFRDAARWGKPLPDGRARGMSFTARHIGTGKSSLLVRAHPNGDIEVLTGATEQGMGILTMIQRVFCEELGLDPKHVRVARGGTDRVPFDPGVGAARETHVVGGAALVGARELRRRLERVACERAAVPEGTLLLRGGAFTSGDGGRSVAWDEAMAALCESDSAEIVASFDGEHRHGEPEWTDFVAYGVELSVDRETGAFSIHEVVLVLDAGTIINPVAFRGQIDGGFVMGYGDAVMEELVVEDGRVMNLSLGEYKIPTSFDVPPLRLVMVREPGGPGPFGARMAGEINTAGVAPAIANAIYEACGARLTSIPLTAERVFAALAKAAPRP
jgi:CO/xanthine dehydrogenase Mo-binding subunit